MEKDGLILRRLDDHPGVLLATIDRPPVNALGLALLRTLRDGSGTELGVASPGRLQHCLGIQCRGRCG